MLAYSCTTVDILMFATFRTTNLVVVVGGEVRWTKVLEIWIDPTLYLPQWINIEEDLILASHYEYCLHWIWSWKYWIIIIVGRLLLYKEPNFYQLFSIIRGGKLIKYITIEQNDHQHLQLRHFKDFRNMLRNLKMTVTFT